MTAVVVIASVMLLLAAVLALIRIALGPTILDRVVGLDVTVAVLVGALATEAVFNRHSDTIPVIVVLALVGFIGSTSVARYAPGRKREDQG